MNQARNFTVVNMQTVRLYHRSGMHSSVLFHQCSISIRSSITDAI